MNFRVLDLAILTTLQFNDALIIYSFINLLIC